MLRVDVRELLQRSYGRSAIELVLVQVGHLGLPELVEHVVGRSFVDSIREIRLSVQRVQSA